MLWLIVSAFKACYGTSCTKFRWKAILDVCKTGKLDPSLSKAFGLDLTRRTTDFTIASPIKTAIFCNEAFVAARHEEECSNKTTFMYYLFCNRLVHDDVGVARGIVFQEVLPVAGFKDHRVSERNVGRATVERPNGGPR